MRTEIVHVECCHRTDDQVMLSERGGERRGFTFPQCDFDRMDFWPATGMAFDLTLSWSRVAGYLNNVLSDIEVWEPSAIGNVILS